MSIPQRADKWIVFALMVGLGTFYVSRNTLPDGYSMLPWIATPITFGAVLTACYLAWCAICRRLSRLLRVVPTSGHVRLFANGSFVVIMLALSFIPFKATFTLHLPAKDHAQNSTAEQAIAKSDPIAALVARLSASHLWQNGSFPILGLPETALVRTDFGDKIGLLKYEDPRTGWWSRVYDSR